MFEKILVPIAFSKYSAGILNYAASMAEKLGSHLIVVNVVNERDLEAVERIASYGYKVDGEHYVDTVQKEREGELEKLFADLTLPDEQVTFKFRVGDPTRELLKIVVKEQVDMVIMGMKTKDLRHLFAGSVAERMFRKCPVTVVSYREKELSEQLEKRVVKQLKKEQ